MITPSFSGNKIGIFNEKETPSYEVRRIYNLTLLGLRFSKILLLMGVVLVVLNNLGIVAPASFFGALNWVMIAVFLIGLVINFVAIPHLYFSSFKNFKKENSCWDKEIFLIPPSLFLGTFFIYWSRVYFFWTFLSISMILVAVIHYNFLRSAWNFLMKSSNEAFLVQQEYFVSLKYMTVYFLVLLVILLLVFFDPPQNNFLWAQAHVFKVD